MRRLLAWFFILLSITSSILAADQHGLTPLPADQAFKLTVTTQNKHTVLLHWSIAPNYYLYRDKFHFRPNQINTARLGQPTFPKTITLKNPILGTYEVYEKNLNITLPIIKASKQTFNLQIHYQGCNKKGFCYPPINKIATIDLSSGYSQPATIKDINTMIGATNIQNTQLTQQSKIKTLLGGGSLLSLITGFLVFGVLISLTPCILPLIPVLSGIIVGQRNLTHKRSILLSLSYIFGMALTYAAAGVLFGAVGSSVQAIFQQPWIIALFSLVFVAMATSLFGFYSIQLPSRWQTSLAHASEKQKGGSYIGVFIMGVLSTLVLSPCATPVLVSVIGYVGATGNAALGGIALFTMAIGMSAPLILIGIFGAKALPKPGPWMQTTKEIIGIILIGIAIWMLSRILPGGITMLLWTALAIGSAIYFGAFATTKHFWQHVGKGVGITLFVYGIIIAIGAGTGSVNPLEPLNFKFLRRQVNNNQLKFITVKTPEDIEKQLNIAKKSGRPVMLDFYADWCISCKEMDEYTFGNAQVKNRLKKYNYLLLRANVTANNVEDRNLGRYYNVVAPPTVIFFNKNGQQEIRNARVIGEMNAKDFLKHLAQIKNSV